MITDRAFDLYGEWAAARANGRPFDLHAHCPEPELRGQVERLIAEDQSPAPNGDSRPPDTERYRFQALIARGGMGEIWRAYDVGLQRDVAVKLLKPFYGQSPDQFLTEARLVARLEHPAIVPVYDAGRLADDRPFFAMKLIRAATDPNGTDGPPPTLEQILGGRPAPSDEISRFVQIFQQICEAVAYAHAQSPPILHRDLKPSNVMVGTYGEVLVMDWGIAKILRQRSPTSSTPGPANSSPTSETADAQAATTDWLANTGSPSVREQAGGNRLASTARNDGRLGPKSAEDSADQRDMTLPGQAKGTWLFMAPEQARGEIERIGPATDVFGLGAILKAILTGRPVHLSGPDVWERARSSNLVNAISRLDSASADPQLIEIAKTCIQPDPAERYPDASAVAKAVADYRAAVVDRLKRSDMERSAAEAKAVEQRKRRRAQAALGGIAIIVLTAGVAATAWQAVRATKAQAGESKRAMEADEARRVAEAVEDNKRRLLTVVLSSLHAGVPKDQVDYLVKTGRPVSELKPNQEILEQLAQIENEAQPDSIAATFPDQPAEQASLLHTIGYVYLGQGQYEKASLYLHRADETYLKVFPPNHQFRLNNWVHRIAALRGLGRNQEAIDQLELLIGVRRTDPRAGTPTLPALEHNLAVMYSSVRRHGKAIELLERLDREITAGGPPNRRFGLQVQQSLGAAYLGNHDLKKAIDILELVRTQQMEALTEDDPDTLTTIHLLGIAYLDSGRRPDALKCFETAYTKRRERLGPDNWDTLASEDLKAQALLAMGEREAALTSLLDASIRKDRRDPLSPSTLITLHNLAQVLALADRYSEAVDYLRKVVSRWKERGESDVSNALVHRATLARLLNATGQRREAEEILKAVRVAQLREMKNDDPQVQRTSLMLSMVQIDDGRYEEGAQEAQQCVILEQDKANPDANILESALASVGLARLYMSDFAQARRAIEQCLNGRKQSEAGTWKLANTEVMLGWAMLGEGNLADAKAHLVAGYTDLSRLRNQIPVEYRRKRLEEALDALVLLSRKEMDETAMERWKGEYPRLPPYPGKPSTPAGTAK